MMTMTNDDDEEDGDFTATAMTKTTQTTTKTTIFLVSFVHLAAWPHGCCSYHSKEFCW